MLDKKRQEADDILRGLDLPESGITIPLSHITTVQFVLILFSFTRVLYRFSFEESKSSFKDPCIFVSLFFRALFKLYTKLVYVNIC